MPRRGTKRNKRRLSRDHCKSRCLVSLERKNRPSITQVSEHPCWTEEEAKCDFARARQEQTTDSEVNQPKGTGSTVPEESGSGHVQLSDVIRIFFNQKLSTHAEIYCGEQLYGHFASLPIVVKMVDENEHNKREPRILSKLNHHSNIISLIETGLFHNGFESLIYIAIDKCHDENLQDFILNRNELSFDEKIIIVEQLIDGVRYIHDKNIVHLDLKPANILFSLDQKTIKIADFGLSEELSGKKMFLKYQFGTSGFRPPESFGNSYISLKTDIFSLGVVIFFVLSSGKNPFGEDLDALNVNVKNGKFDLSSLLVPNLHATKHLIKCMIEMERKNRPSITQVSEHPCWSEEEAKCDFEYATFESSDSDPQSDSEEDELESDLTTLTELLARYSSKDEPSGPAFIMDKQPPGSFGWGALYSSLLGYEGDWTIVLKYNFPQGCSEGVKYECTRFKAYMPCIIMAINLRGRLQKAFDAGQVFKLRYKAGEGTGEIVWGDIPHKTNLTGGPDNNGYPDCGYLDRLDEALRAKGF